MTLNEITDGTDDMPEEFKKVMAQFAPEELHADLVPHRRDDSMLPMIHHPLVVSIAAPHMNKSINQLYSQKKATVEKAKADGDWSRFLFMHERPYRYDALKEAIGSGLASNPKLYWELVGSVWTDSENIHQSLRGWERIWSAPVLHREEVMNEDERVAFATLPAAMTVYRGVGHPRFQKGMSWTLDKARAEWFAKRFAGSGGRAAHVYSGLVAKPDVLAHFLGRGEDEIVVLPKNVKDISEL